MKLNMDSIQFENRSEIDDIILALEEWKKSHVKDNKSETVQELINKLDSMYMSW